MMQRHLLSILIENEAGALTRLIGIFAQRNLNIESLSVAQIEDDSLTRLTLLTEANLRTIQQVKKHIDRQVGVLKVVDLTDVTHVERELMLVRVKSDGETREEVKRTCDIFRGQIVDVTTETYTIQLVGPSDKLMAFLDAIGFAQILEVVRSGVTVIARGAKQVSS